MRAMISKCPGGFFRAETMNNSITRTTATIRINSAIEAEKSLVAVSS